MWGRVLLLTLFASLVLNKLYMDGRVYEMSNWVRYPTVLILRTLPDLFFIMAGAAFERLLSLKIKRPTAAVCALVSLSLYIAVEHMTKNNANLIWFYLGANPAAFFVTGIFGSLAVIFAAILLPQECSFLSSFGEESMHIMALHYPPIPIIELVTGLWFRVMPNSIRIVPAAIVTADVFAFSVLVFEPICRFVRRRVGLIKSHGKG